MTIKEAHAVNEVAQEVITLSKTVAITPALEHGVGILLLKAEKRLDTAAGIDGHFGYSAGTFFEALERSR